MANSFFGPNVVARSKAAAAAALAAQGKSTVENAAELLPSWLYASTSIGSGNSDTEILLFKAGIGETFRSETLTYRDTNLKKGGELPGSDQFLVRAIVVTYWSTADAVSSADLAECQNGWAALFVNSKPYPDYIQQRALIGGPQIRTPATTSGHVGDGRIDNILSFAPANLVAVGKGAPFHFQLNWSTAPTPVISTMRVTVFLWGQGTRQL